MQQDRQQLNNENRFLLEHIGQSIMGEEVSPNVGFREYGIAKIKRLGGRIDYVVVKWDNDRFIPHVCFDPNCTKGTIAEILSVFIYARKDDPIEVEEKPKAEFPTPDVKTMSHEDMKYELMFLHGLKEEEVKEYKNTLTRRAKVIEMRSKLLLK